MIFQQGTRGLQGIVVEIDDVNEGLQDGRVEMFSASEISAS